MHSCVGVMHKVCESNIQVCESCIHVCDQLGGKGRWRADADGINGRVGIMLALMRVSVGCRYQNTVNGAWRGTVMIVTSAPLKENPILTLKAGE